MKKEEIRSLIKKQQPHFHPVVLFDPAKDKLLSLDFTASNRELTHDIMGDTSQFILYINNKLAKAGARYGIGGYAEHRTVYSISNVFDGDKAGDEPRRLHLGIDIWGEPYTKVMAPLDGIIHSFAFNNRFGDYGPTIILSHSIGEFIFYTLYGHLSFDSIKNIKEGDLIEKGNAFAEMGIPEENGYWPPHLHFQIIIDIGEWKGDYPGVCKYSEKENFLLNSPDPDIILQLNQFIKI
jgi:murein DD-endopeptidase MepM/ murein hydrolase activator NlpD